MPAGGFGPYNAITTEMITEGCRFGGFRVILYLPSAVLYTSCFWRKRPLVPFYTFCSGHPSAGASLQLVTYYDVGFATRLAHRAILLYLLIHISLAAASRNMSQAILTSYR
jgi:hypothetical protein